MAEQADQRVRVGDAFTVDPQSTRRWLRGIRISVSSSLFLILLFVVVADFSEFVSAGMILFPIVFFPVGVASLGVLWHLHRGRIKPGLALTMGLGAAMPFSCAIVMGSALYGGGPTGQVSPVMAALLLAPFFSLGAAIMANRTLVREPGRRLAGGIAAGVFACFMTAVFAVPLETTVYSPQLEREAAAGQKLQATDWVGRWGKSSTTFVEGPYRFTYTPGAPDPETHSITYTVSAGPIDYGNRVRSFFSDQTKVVRATRADRPATASDSPCPSCGNPPSCLQMFDVHLLRRCR
jgi:hypothetical protein